MRARAGEVETRRNTYCSNAILGRIKIIEREKVQWWGHQGTETMRCLTRTSPKESLALARLGIFPTERKAICIKIVKSGEKKKKREATNLINVTLEIDSITTPKLDAYCLDSRQYVQNRIQCNGFHCTV